MRIRHLTLAATLAAAPVLAQAQSVTWYGLVDVGVETMNNVGSARERLTRMPSYTGTLPSRLGVRGAEDLGSGVSVVYTLENGFAPDSGSMTQGGRLFGRQAWAGLAAPWGTVSFGRIYTMTYWSLLDADVIGPAIFSAASIDSYLPNARVDNALGYKASFGPLTVGATYSFGRDAVNAGPSPAGTNCAGERAGDAVACREWSAMVKLDTPAWGAAAVIDRFHGGPGAYAGLTASSRTDQRLGLNGYARLGATKLGGGLIARDNQGAAAPRSTLWYLGASWAATPALTLDAQFVDYRVRASADRARLPVLRAVYAFSRRTAVYATAARIDNRGALAYSVSGGAPGGTPDPGGAQTGFMIGMRHAF